MGEERREEERGGGKKNNKIQRNLKKITMKERKKEGKKNIYDKTMNRK